MKIFKNKFFQFGLAVLGGVVLFVFISEFFVKASASFFKSTGLGVDSTMQVITNATALIGMRVDSGLTGINIGPSTMPGARLHIKGNLSVASSGRPFLLVLKDSPFLGSAIKSFLPINLNGISYYAELMNGDSHTFSECTTAPISGTIATDNGVTFCNLPGLICPSGWTPFQSWSQTKAKTCSPTIGNAIIRCASLAQCTTDSHNFSSISKELCTYKNTVNGEIDAWEPNCVASDSQVCYADVIRVGCY